MQVGERKGGHEPGGWWRVEDGGILGTLCPGPPKTWNWPCRKTHMTGPIHLASTFYTLLHLQEKPFQKSGFLMLSIRFKRPCVMGSDWYCRSFKKNNCFSMLSRMEENFILPGHTVASSKVTILQPKKYKEQNCGISIQGVWHNLTPEDKKWPWDFSVI